MERNKGLLFRDNEKSLELIIDGYQFEEPSPIIDFEDDDQLNLRIVAKNGNLRGERVVPALSAYEVYSLYRNIESLITGEVQELDSDFILTAPNIFFNIKLIDPNNYRLDITVYGFNLVTTLSLEELVNVRKMLALAVRMFPDR